MARERPVRVLIVTPGYLPRLGGMERLCALLAAEFQRRGLEVTVLTERTYPHLPLREELDGVEVIRMRTASRRNLLTFALVGWQMAAHLIANRRRYRFAVIQTLTFPALVIGLLKLLRLLPYRTWVTSNTGGEEDDVIALRGYRAWRAFRRVLGHHDALNSVCQANYDHYLELGFDESKLSRIPNGVDLAPFAASSYPERITRFAFLGRITREKGVWEMVDAFARVHARHPDASLVIAGEGEDEDALARAVAEGGLDGSVEFLGRIPQEELGAYFDRFDALVLPSYSEGLPMAVLEAAAHRRAVVVTDVGDLRELFGESLFLCRIRDVEDLERAMSEALQPDGPARVNYDDSLPRLSVERVVDDQLAWLDPSPGARPAELGPGWRRLWRHSYRLGLRWLARGVRTGWKGARVGLQRLLVPLDPWRYYELGRVADADFAGPCLDVSSPKLVTSLLSRERRGDWTGVDVFEAEVKRWRAVDPQLKLAVEDATALSFSDASFDHCICVSVIEHMADDGDARAMSEIWRVLRPGGTLHLTTPVALEPRDLFTDRPLYGEASPDGGERTFFERQYSAETLEQRLLGLPWEVERREFARQRNPRIERRFYRLAPWSYLYGPLLRFRCPRNFEVSGSPELLRRDGHGTVYLVLRKPRSERSSR